MVGKKGMKMLKCQECRGSFKWDPNKTLRGDKPRKCPKCSNKEGRRKP